MSSRRARSQSRDSTVSGSPARDLCKDSTISNERECDLRRDSTLCSKRKRDRSRDSIISSKRVRKKSKKSRKSRKHSSRHERDRSKCDLPILSKPAHDSRRDDPYTRYGPAYDSHSDDPCMRNGPAQDSPKYDPYTQSGPAYDSCKNDGTMWRGPAHDTHRYDPCMRSGPAHDSAHDSHSDFPYMRNEPTHDSCSDYQHMLRDLCERPARDPIKESTKECTYYNGNGCKFDEKCVKLHLCRHYLKGHCVHGESCQKSHNFWDSQPTMLLTKWGIDISKSEREIREKINRSRIITNSDSPKASTKECTYYNGNGCTFDEKCVKLHLCRYYLKGHCKKSGTCKKSHNFWDYQPTMLLIKWGIDISRSEDDIRDEINGPRIMSNSGHRPKPPISRGGCYSFYQHLRSDLAWSNVSGSDEHPDICVFHLRGKCNYGPSCKNYHSKQGVPYQWQLCRSGNDSWVDIDKKIQADIEKSFCDPQNTEANTKIDLRVCKINFLEMRYYLAPNRFGLDEPISNAVRRICTKFTVTTSSKHQLNTIWLWYWQNDNKVWTKFGEDNGDASVCLSSKDIEEEYNSGRGTVLSFERESMHYELDFKNMEQTNTDSGTIRKIRRRPVEFDTFTKQPVQQHLPSVAKTYYDPNAAPLSKLSTKIPLTTPIVYPTSWDLNSHNDNNFLQIVQIQSTGSTAQEYAEVVKLFGATMSDPVKSIRRIQNVELWDAFHRKKASMERKLQILPTTAAMIKNIGRVPGGGTNSTNIQRLFHGTKQVIVDAICQQGFDWRLNGSAVGTLYGKGSYFAKKAKYSSEYTDSRTMFLVQVLVGEYTRGSTTMVRPPPKDLAKPLLDLYDSCVDNVADPNIFVVFTQEQAYPEYLIEY